MIKCSECGASQLEGTLFCSECGSFLLETEGRTTAVLPFSDFAGRLPPPPINQQELTPSSAIKILTIVIPSSRRRIKLQLKEEIRVGRRTPETEPELDLSQDDAAEKGVSRLHALIKGTQSGVVLVDLESTNGTLLNTFRLTPQEPYPLKNGDEVRFGDLLVHIFFDE